ncbi:MAG TPA: hypothetical protein DCZ94_15970 [Lentisphaeria bacterium]|nr:hypothetical protein [Lentisphaeria bacterium]
MIPQRTVKVSDLPYSLGICYSHTSIAYMKRVPGYQEAKYNGNPDAGLDLVKSLIFNQRSFRRLGFMLRHLDLDRKIYFVPVINAERNMRLNTIPVAYAEILAFDLEKNANANVDVLRNIVKIGKPNTGRNHTDRLSNPIVYDGPIRERDAQYVIADDVYTFGRTFMSLIEHIKLQGGSVTAVTTLSMRYTHRIKPDMKLVEDFKKAYNITDKEFKEVSGHEIGYFTAAELLGLIQNYNRKNGIEGLKRIFSPGDGRQMPLGLQEDTGKKGIAPAVQDPRKIWMNYSPSVRITPY